MIYINRFFFSILNQFFFHISKQIRKFYLNSNIYDKKISNFIKNFKKNSTYVNHEIILILIIQYFF